MLPEIPGELVHDRWLLDNLKENVCKLLGTDMSPRKFPGAQPISFDSGHLEELCRENYFVSEKADGIRCLLYTRTLPDSSVESYLVEIVHCRLIVKIITIDRNLDCLYLD
jgi:mRNA guanylyltransferase